MYAIGIKLKGLIDFVRYFDEEGKLVVHIDDAGHYTKQDALDRRANLLSHGQIAREDIFVCSTSKNLSDSTASP